ncbi:MAG: YqfO family protein [Victivallaceae bacterium]
MKGKYYKLEIYVPESHVTAVKNAIFQAGVGKIGNYDCCCWETGGTGQFRPLSGSNPFIGSEGRVEQVTEVKLETICPENVLETVIAALKAAHPYETPAYQFWLVNCDY